MFFLQDAKRSRRFKVNFLLILNCLLFLTPLIMAYLSTSTHGNMWRDGSAAILWIYMAVLPICLFFQLILIGLKIVFSRKKIVL